MSDEALSQNQVENLLKAMETANLDEDGKSDASAKNAEHETPPQSDTPVEANDSGEQAGGSELSNQDDIDSLLAANQTKSDIPTPASKATSPASVKTSAGKPYSPGVPPGARVAAYDFKRPERVGKDQMRALQSLHESIARNFGASISGLLRTMLEVKLLSVDQLTYSEFVFSLDNPSCFNIIQPAPLEGHWVLDIAPPLAYAIIDRMLGGEPVPGETIRRPLTEIETRLMCRVVELFLEQIIPAWENIVHLKPVIEATESNPQLAQVVPPNEVAILIGFEVLLGKNRGMMNLCIPFNTIEKYNSKLSRNGWVGYGKSAPTAGSRRQIADSIDAAPVDVVVTLARSRIRTSDLLDLAVGDIITTEKEAGHPLELAIQNVPKFHATAGAYKGKKAIQIQGMIEPKRRPVVEDELHQDSEESSGDPTQDIEPNDATESTSDAITRASQLLEKTQSN